MLYTETDSMVSGIVEILYIQLLSCSLICVNLMCNGFFLNWVVLCLRVKSYILARTNYGVCSRCFGLVRYTLVSSNERSDKFMII